MASKIRALSMLMCICCGAAASGMKKQDVARHIECSVCKTAVDAVSTHVAKKDLVMKKDTQEEDDITSAVEDICSNNQEGPGKWIAHSDVTRYEGGKKSTGGFDKLLHSTEHVLRVQHNHERLQCKQECEAVKLACTASTKNKEKQIVQLLMDGSSTKELHAGVCGPSCDRELDASELVNWEDEEYFPEGETDVVHAERKHITERNLKYTQKKKTQVKIDNEKRQKKKKTAEKITKTEL